MPALSAFFPAAPSPGRPGDPGLFGPGSAAWRIGRERLLLAGGPAALLLQVAHPLVAAGVAAHSDFTADPLRRLRGTLDAVLTVTFGDRDQVRAAADAVARRHASVRGTLDTATGAVPAGTPYDATDPDLATWVLATLVWTAVEVTDRFARPVPPAERDAYVRDLTRLGRVLGVPDALVPDGYRALDRYVDEQVHAVLSVGPTARRLADQILAPEPPLLPAPVRPLPALLAAGVLPAPVRDAYGLAWRRREQVAFGVAAGATRLALPLLPAPVRLWPHHRAATRRLRAAGPSA